jgi:hypothetical protein
MQTMRRGGDESTHLGSSALLRLAALVLGACSNTGPAIEVEVGTTSTSESGANAIAVVSLATEPSADVTIDVLSTNVMEGTVDTSRLVFTPSDWNAPRSIAISGVDDSFVDGDQVYTVVLLPASSTDGDYAERDADDLVLTNTDDDAVGLIVTPSQAITTSESGGLTTAKVQLRAQPHAPVQVTLSSTRPDEARLSKTTLTFSPEAWNVPQAIDVVGVDDLVADGAQDYAIDFVTTSTDPLFTGFALSVSGRTADDDIADILVSSSMLTTRERGPGVTFTIALTSKPMGMVTIPIASSNPSEGMTSVAQVVFTPTDHGARTVTVTGVDDASADGNQAYSINFGAAQSTFPDYAGRITGDLSVLNLDDDSASIVVASVDDGMTTELGGTSKIRVLLSSKPAQHVTVALASDDLTEGTISPGSITITPAQWDVPQIVTVTGVPDGIADGHISYHVVTSPSQSADPQYDNLDSADVYLSNVDSALAAISVTPTSGLQTFEAGGQTTFTISLATKPTGSVTIPLTSSLPNEVTITPATVTFTPADHAPRTVTLAGRNDFLIDGNLEYVVELGPAVSAFGDYNGIDALDVAVTSIDNDVAGVSFSPMSPTVSESGATTTVAFTLNTQPTHNVYLNLRSTDLTEATLSPLGCSGCSFARLEFTPQNWNQPHLLTISGVNDTLKDGTQRFAIDPEPLSSLDPDYEGLEAQSIPLAVTDDDVSPPAITNVRINGVAAVNDQIILPVTVGQTASDKFTITFDTSTPGNDPIGHRADVITKLNTWASRSMTAATGPVTVDPIYYPSAPLLSQTAVSIINVPGLGTGYVYNVHIWMFKSGGFVFEQVQMVLVLVN